METEKNTVLHKVTWQGCMCTPNFEILSLCDELMKPISLALKSDIKFNKIFSEEPDH